MPFLSNLIKFFIQIVKVNKFGGSALEKGWRGRRRRAEGSGRRNKEEGVEWGKQEVGEEEGEE